MSRRGRPRRWLPWCVAAALALTALSGCGDDQEEPSTTTTPTAEPAYPSFYIDYAVNSYNLKWADEELAWKPVREDGRLWKGDPRTYEKVCGAEFLAEDGSIPDLDAPPDGSGGTDPSADSWYQWLRGEPERWAAFNAWLEDPAVKAYVEPHARTAEGGRGGNALEIGDSSGCEQAEEAGVPVG